MFQLLSSLEAKRESRVHNEYLDKVPMGSYMASKKELFWVVVFGLTDRVLWHKHALLLMQIRNPAAEDYKKNISLPKYFM